MSMGVMGGKQQPELLRSVGLGSAWDDDISSISVGRGSDQDVRCSDGKGTGETLSVVRIFHARG